MPLLEGVIASVLANRAVATSSKAREKAVEIRRNRRFSEELGPLATEFNDALGERIKDRAEDVENFDLHGVAFNWDAIADQIDAYEVAFESENEALDWLVDEIVGIEDVELDEEAKEELRELLAEEYAAAVADFRDRIEGDADLEHRFQADLEIEVLRHLDEMHEAFHRLADRRPYGLYDFPAEREAVLDTLLPGDPVEFVDREEVPTEPEPGRHFVLGPSGSGKSRIIAERLKRLPNDSVAHVLVPENRMLDPSDAKGLARESFDGDLLLIWEDVHRIDEGGENAILERTLRELQHALDEQGHSLYTLLEARSGRLHNIPGSLPTGFENDKSLWSEYEPLWVGTMDEPHLRDIAVAMAAKFEIALGEAAQDTLVERTVASKSAPVYIETALKTADGELTVDDVAQLAEEVQGIWRSHYDDLQDEEPQEWCVLAAMKLLYDLNVPQFSKLVRAAYLDVLEGDRGQFRSAVQVLQSRGWLTVVGDDIVELEAWYGVHDTQLDPIRVSAKDDARKLSDLLIHEAENTVPKVVRPAIHFPSGLSFYEWGCYSQAERQWETTIDLVPEFAQVHNNYALLLRTGFNELKDAEHHFQEALDINPGNAKAHNNYANLLYEELDRPDDAEHHFQEALNINSGDAKTHYNYANLLYEELDRPDDAKYHYQQALDTNPELEGIYYNYALLLREEFGHLQQAKKHLKTSVRFWIDKGEIQNAIHDLYTLVQVCRKMDDSDAVTENCKLALELLDQSNEHFDARVWFKSMQALAGLSGTETSELYTYALQNIMRAYPELAMELFEAVWEQRDNHKASSADHSKSLSAGVALAAGLRLTDDIGSLYTTDREPTYTADDILKQIDPAELFYPENVLYDWMTGSETEETPSALWSYAEDEERDNNIFAGLEARTFAVLFEIVQSADTGWERLID